MRVPLSDASMPHPVNGIGLCELSDCMKTEFSIYQILYPCAKITLHGQP